MNIYDPLILSKIEDSIYSNKYISNLLFETYDEKEIVTSIKDDIDFFVMCHKHAYQFNNFHNLMYESILNLNDNRFANFIKNIVNNHPDRNRTYNHLFNDIISK